MNGNYRIQENLFLKDYSNQGMFFSAIEYSCFSLLGVWNWQIEDDTARMKCKINRFENQLIPNAFMAAVSGSP